MSEARSDKGEGLGARVKARIAAARRRSPLLDHTLATQEHYDEVNGSVLAAGATYFGFLSFFPILALAFFVAGKVNDYYDDADEMVSKAITSVLPGIIASEPTAGKITLDQIQSAASVAGIIGLVGVLYSGLGWLSGLRGALVTAFGVPSSEKPNFFVGKASDLVTLALIGIVMVVSVGTSGVISGFTDDILDWVGMPGLFGETLLQVIRIALGIGANLILFYVIFRLLPKPDLPPRALWRGALFSGIGFEVLKVVVIEVLGSVGGSPFAPLALSITLVIWINYISRVTVYGAAWAYTDPGAVALRREHERAAYTRPEATAAEQRYVDEPVPARTASEQLIAIARPVAVFGLVIVGVREVLRRYGD